MRNWEQYYQAGDTPWEKGRAAPPLQELIELRGKELWSGGPVLVPGCGFGHDVRALAALGIPVLGLDIAETAIAQAREISVVGAESFEVGDFLDSAWREGRRFSAIWEHTCFCAIDPGQRGDYALAAAELLGPGGLLAGVFFLTPNDPGEEDEGPPFNASIEEIEGLFSPWFERADGWVPGRTYPGREGREWVALFRKLPEARVAGST